MDADDRNAEPDQPEELDQPELRDADDSVRPPRRSLRIAAITIIVVAILLAAVLPVVLGLGG